MLCAWYRVSWRGLHYLFLLTAFTLFNENKIFVSSGFISHCWKKWHDVSLEQETIDSAFRSKLMTELRSYKRITEKYSWLKIYLITRRKTTIRKKLVKMNSLDPYWLLHFLPARVLVFAFFALTIKIHWF
jgi:hypothetical protein